MPITTPAKPVKPVVVASSETEPVTEAKPKKERKPKAPLAVFVPNEESKATVDALVEEPLPNLVESLKQTRTLLSKQEMKADRIGQLSLF